MGVSIGWKPNDPKKVTYIHATSGLHTALQNAFGVFPITITIKDVGKLNGIHACGHDGAYDLVLAVGDNQPEGITIEAEW